MAAARIIAGPADVDVLDAVVERSAFRNRGFERIEIHHQQIDRLDVVLFHRGEVLFVPADRQQSAVHFRMQRLDPAVHHFGRAGEFGDIDHREPGIAECLGRPAGRDQLNSIAGELSDANAISPALSETDSRARVIRRGWLLMTHELAHQAGESVFATTTPRRASTAIGSKRQFRLLRPVGAGAGRRRRRVTEAPAHRRRVAHTSIDHDLYGTSRAVGAGQEHAFLEFDRVGQGREGPQVAVMQQTGSRRGRRPAGSP